MQVVIDIPNWLYNAIMECKEPTYSKSLGDAVRDGTPLPKGHGRLIDADTFIITMEDASKRQKYKELLIDDCLTVDDVFKAVIESLQNVGLANGDTPTVIEADKEDRYSD